MRLIVARCEATYTGRIDAILDDGVRLIMRKADGSVLVHSDLRGYRPLVWQMAPCFLREDDGGAAPGGRWTITNKDNERLEVTFHEILEDVDWTMDARDGLTLAGVERELQELLADHPGEAEPELTLIRREHDTGIGPIDLLCVDPDGVKVGVEIKRVAELSSVEQLSRYVERLRVEFGPTTRGLLVAQRVKPQARTLCDDRGLAWAEVDLDRLRGLERSQVALF